MTIRIVQLCIRPEWVKEFLSVFGEAAPHIRAFPGCIRLELWRQADLDGGFATCSHWENDDALEAYRNSSLFKARWAAIKPMFAAKPRAYSYRRWGQKDTWTPK
ncbi:MAG: antibiotic biosynthesis monooxygenase [Bacteroidota bacterium]|nr:antibiotic biosynthesis monooxygenase [Bacteroidota bacterium]MDE2833940.1 antibiotic biosynthesis monooxygenase [Bacteroidota bacterium]MDE2958268.1 antibiotic biosynthesis monooxygenase [Bacteroidota bacterium]